jgi:hypothetical protein
MTTRAAREHWEQIYGGKRTEDVSWFQREPEMSLRLLDAAGLAADT